MKEIAIIGATASGKSALAHQLALNHNAYILSLDSLSIYKEINIASAKPDKNQLQEITYFGINTIYPDQYFSADLFHKFYLDVKAKSIKENKNLIIVGGTSFYLKSLQTGLSPLPLFNPLTKTKVQSILQNRLKAYTLLKTIDPLIASNIQVNDIYRIEKALLIWEETKKPPSQYYKNNPPVSILGDIDIYNIDIDKELLKSRIKLRTKQIFDQGIIDEVCYLEKKYTREPNCMQSIGIKEVLSYLDGYRSLNETIDLISTHTAQLAKRRTTFNKTQFKSTKNFKKEDILKLAFAIQ